jgi:hypothetical protein
VVAILAITAFIMAVNYIQARITKAELGTSDNESEE